jgi:hypothetical protein
MKEQEEEKYTSPSKEIENKNAFVLFTFCQQTRDRQLHATLSARSSIEIYDTVDLRGAWVDWRSGPFSKLGEIWQVVFRCGAYSHVSLRRVLCTVSRKKEVFW